MKLSQKLAVERSEKRRIYSEVTRLHHESQKPGPLSGIARNYTPLQEDGDQIPSESALVQTRLSDVLEEIADLQTQLFDVTATKDWANTHASADVSVNGRVILAGVPVTYLLFLEKQLSDIHTIVAKLPVLDPAETWTWDPNTSQYRTAVKESFKTKKVLRNHVKAAATDKHPAQVEVYTEDIPVGRWETVKFSGALPQDEKKAILDRVELLQRSVKEAREEANSTQVEEVRLGKRVFDFILDRSES